MINVLFVDDEKDILDGYRRMLFSMKNTWNIFYANSAYEALHLLDSRKIDVVLCDYLMPFMNGMDLLHAIKDKYPNTIRVMLTGITDKVTLISSLPFIHRIIYKPCDTRYIKEVIENSYELRKLIENNYLINVINDIDSLPIIPDIVMEIENVLKNDNVSFAQLSEIIKKDPALTAEILHTINSGFFGLARQINDITEALSFLGINSIKSIMMILYSSKHFENQFAYKAFCKKVAFHSLAVSHIAKHISIELEISKEDTEVSFISALLHDIGKIVLLKLPDYLENKKFMMDELNISDTEADMMLTKTTHNVVGAYLLGIWGFSSQIINTVAYLNNQLVYNKGVITPHFIVKIANEIVKYDFHTFDKNKFNLDWDVIQKYGLTDSIELWWKKAQTLKGINYGK